MNKLQTFHNGVSIIFSIEPLPVDSTIIQKSSVHHLLKKYNIAIHYSIKTCSENENDIRVGYVYTKVVDPNVKPLTEQELLGIVTEYIQRQFIEKPLELEILLLDVSIAIATGVVGQPHHDLLETTQPIIPFNLKLLNARICSMCKKPYATSFIFCACKSGVCYCSETCQKQ